MKMFETLLTFFQGRAVKYERWAKWRQWEPAAVDGGKTPATKATVSWKVGHILRVCFWICVKCEFKLCILCWKENGRYYVSWRCSTLCYLFPGVREDAGQFAGGQWENTIEQGRHWCFKVLASIDYQPNQITIPSAILYQATHCYCWIHLQQLLG